MKLPAPTAEQIERAKVIRESSKRGGKHYPFVREAPNHCDIAQYIKDYFSINNGFVPSNYAIGTIAVTA